MGLHALQLLCRGLPEGRQADGVPERFGRGSTNRPVSGWESLTATERAVSHLVAEGLTNGAVARQLYVSPHTVNTHLRHAFAKLGVSNRVALAAVVHHAIE